MAYKEEVKTTYRTSVICDKCKRERILRAETWHMDIYECPECGTMIPVEVLEGAE